MTRVNSIPFCVFTLRYECENIHPYITADNSNVSIEYIY